MNDGPGRDATPSEANLSNLTGAGGGRYRSSAGRRAIESRIKSG